MNYQKSVEIFSDNCYTKICSFRRPKSLNEMKQNASSEHSRFVRAKRQPKNLPNTWDDKYTCKDVDTARQIRRSQNNYRKSIKTLIVEDSE